MRDRVAELTALLYPADGIDPPSKLFSSPPIESLEWLKELGEIARASFAAEAPAVPETAAAESPPPKAAAASPRSSDAKLLEALLEYHRLRGPTLGARSATAGARLFARADASTAATGESGFNSVEVPVVQDYVPKTSTSPHRASQPVHAVLKSKPRP